MSDPQNYLEEDQWEEYEALPEKVKKLCVTLVQNAYQSGYQGGLIRMTQAAMEFQQDFDGERDV